MKDPDLVDVAMVFKRRVRGLMVLFEVSGRPMDAARCRATRDSRLTAGSPNE
jgi:hypothetical protein